MGAAAQRARRIGYARSECAGGFLHEPLQLETHTPSLLAPNPSHPPPHRARHPRENSRRTFIFLAPLTSGLRRARTEHFS
jgi:hypothetical protein